MKRRTLDNPRYPHAIKVVRTFVEDDPFVENDEAVVMYEGCGRSYTDTTVTGSGKMDRNRRKAVIPVRFDEWAKSLLDGDAIIATMGNIVEEGVIKDVEPDNERTVVYWELGRV